MTSSWLPSGRAPLLASFLLLGLFACTDDSGETEAGETEVGETEAGETEVGETEAGETEAGETETGETETETGETEAGETGFTGVPCLERLTLEDCGAGPVDPDDEYGDMCVWTQLEPASQAEGMCSFGRGESFCLSIPMVLDGCGGTQPSGCEGAENASVAAIEIEGNTYVLDVTDDCDAPREMDPCWVDDPESPAACECACAFAAGG